MTRKLVRLAKVADQGEAIKEAAAQPVNADTERDVVLEEAACICEKTDGLDQYGDAALECAAEAIRARKSAAKKASKEGASHG